MFKKNLMASVAVLSLLQGVALAEPPAQVYIPPISHLAFTDANINIHYAQPATARAVNAAIPEFVQAVVRSRTLDNSQPLALPVTLSAAPRNNFLGPQFKEGAALFSARPVAALTARGTPFIQFSRSANILLQAPAPEPVVQFTRFKSLSTYVDFRDCNYPMITSYELMIKARDLDRINLSRPWKLLVQITNQDRTEYPMAFDDVTGLSAVPEYSSPGVSRSNLVNSSFARFFADKMTRFFGG